MVTDYTEPETFTLVPALKNQAYAYTKSTIESDDAGTEFTEDSTFQHGGLRDTRDNTRQEFKDETDINVILKKFGLDKFANRQMTYGDYNFDLDLQTSLNAIKAAKRVHKKLSPDLQRKYPTMVDVIEAIENGQLREELLEEKTEPGQPAAAPPPETAPAPAP